MIKKEKMPKNDSGYQHRILPIIHHPCNVTQSCNRFDPAVISLKTTVKVHFETIGTLLHTSCLSALIFLL
jgi:hypothetical protein